ncbi:MAG: hypothetical protein ACXWYM_00050 [Candidatus Binatia bacterium]
MAKLTISFDYDGDLFLMAGQAQLVESLGEVVDMIASGKREGVINKDNGIKGNFKLEIKEGKWSYADTAKNEDSKRRGGGNRRGWRQWSPPK